MECIIFKLKDSKGPGSSVS